MTAVHPEGHPLTGGSNLFNAAWPAAAAFVVLDDRRMGR